jgi:hypothetical protein
LDWLIIGNPESKRIELFQKALSGLDLPPARILPYADLLNGRVELTSLVKSGTIVRIESPDRDFGVEKALLALGAGVNDPAGDFDRLPSGKVANLDFEQGLLLYPRQWYLGYRALLHRLNEQLQACPPHKLINHPADIALMFDKPACHALFTANRLAVPRTLGTVSGYAELWAKMQEQRMWRVFVKLAHGSSASGAVAYQVNGTQHQATSTVEVKLYNTRRIRIYRDQTEIARLLEALCRHRVQVEQWLPKAAFQNRIFDLRVLVIGGEAQHVVVRLSRHPFTNLHLANGRTWLDSLLTRLDPKVWETAKQTCEQAAKLFPRSLYAGIDLMLASNYKSHALAEINAYGDLLYHALHNGRDPYTAEIEKMRDEING